MTKPARWILPLLFAALAACGGAEGDKPKEREVMKPEETVFRDLVTAPGKVQDRTDAAMEAHRDALERQLAEDEGAATEGEGR
jgi:hypothetical protein